MRFILLLFAICTLFRSWLAADTFLTSPPSDLPVKVVTNFFLQNFIGMREKDETFEADCYFTFSWNDPRLAFEDPLPEAVQNFTEKAAINKLQEIWWPQIEFINSGTPQISNRTLFIYKNGQVIYVIGFTGNFRSSLDLQDFPFDKQKLQILLDSFIWNDQIVQFVAGKHTKFNLGDSEHNDLTIRSISTKVGTTEGIFLPNFGESQKYSVFEVIIEIQRKWAFYLYQIFVPLVLIIGISCLIYFVDATKYIEIVGLSLTAFLVFLATKFTLNLDLPHVGYMTRIDKAFLVTYLLIGLGILNATIREIWHSPERKWPDKFYFHCRWIVPLLFVLLILWIFKFA